MKDVHTEHCCLEHGCKYCDPNCTVVNGLAKQSYPCEDCEDDEIYVCQICGHEDHVDKFGSNCPKCGVDLEELEQELNDE